MMISRKLMLFRYFSHHLITPNIIIPTLFSSPYFFSLHRTTTTSTTLSTATTTTTYGPSLQKGTLLSKTPLNPFPFHPLQTPQNGHEPETETETAPFDEDYFTRVFEVLAIRVPSEKCAELESRLRGHLLNWPRVSNIARVSGDEVDEEMREILVGSDGLRDEEGVSRAVSRRVYGRGEGDGEELSGVLYRDKIAKEFNAMGFVKFRNLAKISRPVRKKKKGARDEGEKRGEEGEKRRRKRSVVVEVVEENRCFDEDGDGDGGDLSGLLGDEFKGRKWRGSTRLLLLDENCSGRSFDELPEAVKVII